MHQTFYIDVDEEISSVIDRLNKSMSIESYFVVPKRALFFQSIVNLKILKREADKVGKIVIVVTQDEMGISMAERTGLEVRENLDEVETVVSEPLLIKEDEYEQEEIAEEFPATDFSSVHDKQVRLNNIGSGDFYQQNEKFRKPERKTTKSFNGNAERLMPAQPSKNSQRVSIQKTLPSKIVLEKKKLPMAKNKSASIEQAPFRQSSKLSSNNRGAYVKLDPQKAQTLEKMYSVHQPYAEAVKQPQAESKQIHGGNFKKVFLFFMLLVSTVIVGVAGYLFIPSAKITISANIGLQKINEDVVASANVSEIEQSNIPLRVIEQNQQVAIPYKVDGKAVVSGKKAHGTVVISNEFSNEPQTLIATTRLQSEDGKIFRINKNVVVPGYSNIAGQIKPGVIQAEVTADQAGEDYNIGATKFTIPGFSQSAKFDKFYATSSEAMIGGSVDGQTSSGGALMQADLDSARQKTESVFKEKMDELIKSGLSEGEIALPQATKITIAKSNSTAKVGTATESFDWVVVGSVKALVFSENDIKTVLSSLSKSDSDVKQDISKLDYGGLDPDFDGLTMRFKVYGDMTSTPNIDAEKIKAELLGKKDDQLADILKKYSFIKNANVEFAPTFITRVPEYSSRVVVEIKNEP